MANYDFSGWATKNNIKCSDGRTIIKNAFLVNDGADVPLVWQHQHNDVDNVLGHVKLENRDEGVYAYGYFNSTEKAQTAKELIKHRDINALSIYANQLQQKDGKVFHGNIREVSLVLAGANPGAYIDAVIEHSDNGEDVEDAIIYTGEELSHAEEKKSMGKEKTNQASAEDEKTKQASAEDEKTIADIFEELTEEQKSAVYAIVGTVVEDYENEENLEEEDDEDMKHNIFENDIEQGDFLTHSEEEAIFSDVKKYGTLKESAIAHGIEEIGNLFPDAQTVTPEPVKIARPQGWVDAVMSGVKRSPFSRIKSSAIDVTAEAARAKGYKKGTLKKEEIVTALKRSTDPTTIYKKQKLDRDDVIDITDFDVVAWIKKEMREMLDEEIARAILVGDGRTPSDDDKVDEMKIRPIWKDDAVYTIRETLTLAANAKPEDKARQFIRTAIKTRKNYRGTGSPTLFITEDMLTEMLLLEDTTGRAIYDSVDKLATVMRVSKVVSVPVMEGLTREESGKTKQLHGIIVNLNDYRVGADKGGAVSLFDDFDIDYNAQKYLIETRCSGALVMPASAIAIEEEVSEVTG